MRASEIAAAHRILDSADMTHQVAQRQQAVEEKEVKGARSPERSFGYRRQQHRYSTHPTHADDDEQHDAAGVSVRAQSPQAAFCEMEGCPNQSDWMPAIDRVADEKVKQHGKREQRRARAKTGT
jgi:hypothetical protein